MTSPGKLLSMRCPMLAITLSFPTMYGRANTSTFSASDVKITVTGVDRSAAAASVLAGKHPSYTQPSAGVAARGKTGISRQPEAAPAVTAARQIADYDYTQNPGDVTYQGGPTIKYAASHAV